MSLHRRVLLENLVRDWSWYFEHLSSDDSSRSDSSSGESSSSDTSSDESSSEDSDRDDDLGDGGVGDDGGAPACAASGSGVKRGYRYADGIVSTDALPSVAGDGAGPSKRARLDDMGG
ncbi:hypothetical protein MTO96_000741 [Rhipicephalus appendiculatus]